VKLSKNTLPKIIKDLKDREIIDEKLIDHYSYSSLVKFSTNPFMFKVKYLNRDHIDTAHNISGIIGRAFHVALQNYYENKDTKDVDEIKKGLETGMEFLEEYVDKFIDYNSVIPNKQKAQEILAFAYNSYITAKKDEDCELIATEELIEEEIDVEWQGKQIRFPVRLKGYIDKIVRENGKLIVTDYKSTRSFSDPDKIDGAKILQAIQYYFLVYAKYGEPPYAMRYEETKTTKNRNGEPQLKEYEIVYEENQLFFDFYFRFYEDTTRAIHGEAVFVPNINDFYDNEVALIAYIHRLDVPEEQAKQMKKLRVDNITDLLKKKIQNAGNMRKLMKTAEKKFISAKNLNYNNMKLEEKIETKLMEHGMLIKFDSKVEGHTIDLYRYSPSIGLKMSKIKGYVADIEQVAGVSGIRILAPIPNTTLIGFEVPKKERKFIETKPKPDGFKLSMGVDIMGQEYQFDIRKAPHMLIAGATGSGKSVFLNSLINQLSQNKDLDLHLFDPKMVELSQFASKAIEYKTDTEEIHNSLKELVEEMNKRYVKLAKDKARSIEQYTGKMKYKAIVIDEFGDLIMSNIIKEEEVKTKEKYKSGKLKGQFKTKIKRVNLSNEITRNLLLLAQKARACGIHIIIATQRPSTDIITGTIKANFPTKVAFRTAKAVDSQVLLDEYGAEKLLGKGDMLFSSDDGQIRLQGYLI
jgi:energy-coupling factor transporter ATP-binding protein EcfA2